MPDRNIGLGKDLRFQFDQLGADLVVTPRGDLDTVSGEDNIVQAIMDRLATEQGELHDTGHANYGSRLDEFVGEINNETTRQRIKLEVLECLAQEDRIREVVNVDAVASAQDPHGVEIEITILPVESKTYLTIVYPFRLEVG
jgi:phage baseplate assembly protein W